MIRLSVSDRGRAVPLIWRGIEHGSAAVSPEAYPELWDEAKVRLPLTCQVGVLADRGFADTQRMSPLRQLGWQWRIRIKSNFWIYPSHLTPCQVGEIELKPGHLTCWQEVEVTENRFGPVH